MPRVDFYILPEAGREARSVERFACRVTARAWTAGNRVHLHTASEQMTEIMDDLLWTFRDVSFIPHERYAGDSGDNPETPVTIGHARRPPPGVDLIINLDHAIPDFAPKAKRIIEIAGGDEDHRQQARQRYRQYRAGEYELHDHRIDARTLERV